jgi:NAD dependent epimerase/dehydratase family enzyme
MSGIKRSFSACCCEERERNAFHFQVSTSMRLIRVGSICPAQKGLFPHLDAKYVVWLGQKGLEAGGGRPNA